MPAKLPLIMAGLLLSVAALLAACGSSVEQASPTRTESPTSAPAATTAAPSPIATPNAGGGGGNGTVITIPTLPSPKPIPDSWANYEDPGGRFTLRYPTDWLVDEATLGGAILRNYLQPTVGPPRFPQGAIKIDLIVTPPSQGGCPDAPEEAGTTTLGGVPAAQWIRSFGESYDSSGTGVTRGHFIFAEREGSCFGLASYFAQDNPDEQIFLQIASSFQFTK